MNKNMKGRGNLRRPLPIRLLAVIMAVVMVFSVIIVTNRSDKVKADSESSVSAVSSVASSATENCTVNVPAKGVKVLLNMSEVLPDTEEAVTDIKLFLNDDPAAGDDVKYVAVASGETAPDSGYTEVPIKGIFKKSVKWYVGTTEAPVVDSGDLAGNYYIESQAIDVTATLIEKAAYVFTKADDSALEELALSKITAKKPNPADVSKYSTTVSSYSAANVTLACNEAELTFSDADQGESSGIDAAVITYDVSKDGTAVKSGAGYSDVMDYINSVKTADTTGDGTYKIDKKVQIQDVSGNMVDVVTKTASVKRNAYVLKTFSVESVSKTYPTDKELNYPASGYANPASDIVINYTADVAPSTITVSPDKVGGKSITIEKNTSGKITIPGEDKFIKTNYKLMKWKKSINSNDPYFKPDTEEEMTSFIENPVYDFEVEYYAYFLNNYKTVTLYSNNGTNEYKELYFESGDKVCLSSDYTKTGHDLKGWSLTLNGSRDYYASCYYLSNSMSLYAIWEPITYSIWYSSVGGSGSMPIQYFKYDEEQALSTNIFTRNGYKFSKWNTKSDGTGTDYEDGQVVKNLTSESYGRIYLYAKWDPINYYVHFNPNGREGEMEDQMFS